MLFLTYWKLNERMSLEDRQEIAQQLTGEELFPPEGVEVLRWDGTPDGWGIVLWDADDYASLYAAINVWRAAGTPFFEETKTAPAAPAAETIEELRATVEELSSWA